jgi:FXSXX-COOH protein
MDATGDNRPPELVSSLVDLRRIPLTDVPAYDEAAITHTLRRILPESADVQRVPIAAFQSAI